MPAKNGRKKVTAVHKANIMKLTDGLFLRTFREVAAEYPEITADDCIIDALCMKLVQKPEQFDVLVAPNLYGDIISDLCAGLVGGLGFAPSANIGDSTRIYEAVHGSAPDIAGQDKANPSAILMAFAMMLNDLGETDKPPSSMPPSWPRSRRARSSLPTSAAPRERRSLPRRLLHDCK